MELTRWAVVLAGGAGVRLRGISPDEAGLFVPKQYCALDGEPLIAAALRRAESIAAPDRVVLVVAEEHRAFWEAAYGDDPRVVVQPHRRGLAAAALLGILAVLERDPSAHVTLVPADQSIADEAPLFEALAAAPLDEAAISLIGTPADYVTTDYGWLAIDAAGEARFEEKPGLVRAIELFDRGAYWSTGIACASGAAWLSAFEAALPTWVEALTAAFDCAPGPYRELVLENRFDALEAVELSPLFEVAPLRAILTELDSWADLESPRALAPYLDRIAG